jgi:serine/threonine protein kinase
LGRWHGAVVAIKISRAISKKQRLDFLNEILIMTALTAHPHRSLFWLNGTIFSTNLIFFSWTVITLMGICLNGEYPALVLEYADGGTLEKYVQQNVGNMPELEIVRVAREVRLISSSVLRFNF